MMARHDLSGWIMLEAMLVLTIASLVAIPLGETMGAVVRGSAEAGERLHGQASRAVAAAAVLRLTEQGHPPHRIKSRLEPHFPALTFWVEDSVCHVEVRDR